MDANISSDAKARKCPQNNIGRGCGRRDDEVCKVAGAGQLKATAVTDGASAWETVRAQFYTPGTRCKVQAVRDTYGSQTKFETSLTGDRRVQGRSLTTALGIDIRGKIRTQTSIDRLDSKRGGE